MAQIRVGKLLLHTGLATAQCLNQKALLICLRIALQLSGTENVVVHGSWYRNFIIKWIVGPGVTAEISGAELNTTYQNNGDTFGIASEELLYFTEEPTMSIMNCGPIIEVANASVIVARSSGNVPDFVLLSDTQPDQNAWEYAWDIMYPEPTRNDADGSVR
ncbi:hypothetical protein AA0113_g2473 [Alternaria arborescens]|uniref:Uncharacterized protein n=1 Tax=Alternaria arborescens TaxID=156630 RepID=A0A4Q4SKA5_9PLEO|nr:hypothetical protein AA0113_g2473 [Alternaria arborescens]